MQWIIFPQASWIHDYWVNSYLFSLCICSAIAIKHIDGNGIKFFILVTVIMTSSIGFDDLERRQTEEFSLEMQAFIQERINDDSIVITDNTIWGQHTFKFMLPDSTIHISNSENKELFLKALNQSSPDFIIHANQAWEGWNSESELLSKGYCNQDIPTRWNLDPYTVWTKCT